MIGTIVDEGPKISMWALWCLGMTSACGASPPLADEGQTLPGRNSAVPQTPAPSPASASAQDAAPSSPPTDNGIVSLDVQPEPGPPRGTAWLLRERDLHSRPFRHGELLATLPFNTEVTLLEEPDLTALERAAMVDAVAVAVPNTGLQGWIGVDMEEAPVLRDSRVTPRELKDAVEVVRAGLMSGEPTVGRLGSDILGLRAGEPLGRPQMLGLHERLQRRRYDLAPGDLDAICGLASAMAASNKTLEAASLRVQALATVGDPIAHWMSAEQATGMAAARRAYEEAESDQALAAVQLTVEALLPVLSDAAQSDFDPLTGHWCSGKDPWVDTVLPGVEALTGIDGDELSMEHGFSLWLNRDTWQAQAAKTEGALDDDLLALRRDLWDGLHVDDIDFGDSCTTLGDPKRNFVSVLKKLETFTAAGGAISRLALVDRTSIIELLGRSDRCSAVRSDAEAMDPAGEVEDILSEVELLPGERQVLRALLERLQTR